MKILKSIPFVLFLLNFSLPLVACSCGISDYKLPDEIGNLYKTKEKTDRQYGRAGQLLKDVYTERSQSEMHSYTYNEVGRRLTKTFKEETTHFV